MSECGKEDDEAENRTRICVSRLPMSLRARKPWKDMDGALNTIDCFFESGVSFSKSESSCSDSETPGSITSTTRALGAITRKDRMLD